jgi:hypothetical protein
MDSGALFLLLRAAAWLTASMLTGTRNRIRPPDVQPGSRARMDRSRLPPPRKVRA